MNGFLVIGRCELDDVPLLLTAARGEALSFAEGVTPEQVCRVAGGVMDLDTSVVHAVAVMEFRGGRPFAMDVVRKFGSGGVPTFPRLLIEEEEE